MHGNEPSGVIALLEMEIKLRERAADMRGMIIGLIGNFRALEEDVRFIDKDLNRMWSRDDFPTHWAEVQEKSELSFHLEQLLHGSGERYVLDLHSTSSDTDPFMSISKTERDKAFAAKFSIPSIAGIDEFIEGPLLGPVSARGHVGLAFEAGQHLARRSVEEHENFISESLYHSGILCEPSFEGGNEDKQFDIVYRHAIKEGDGFRMQPGYENFTPVHKGQPLARDKNGPILCPMDGLLFMPLYQKQGNDGFFIIV